LKDIFQKIFPFLALLVLLLFVGQVWKNYDRPYLKYQRQFKALLIQKAGGQTVDFKFGVRQRWIEALNRADRCETCHLGVDDPRFKDAPEPFRTHPNTGLHSFEKFGCTVCHNGQGAATSLQEAHGPAADWYKAMYHENFMDNSCSRCHGENIKDQAPVYAAGLQTFADNGCRGCHLIKGKDRVKAGIPLDGLAARVKTDWLYRWIKNPKAYLTRTTMPDFKFSELEAAEVAAFILKGAPPSGISTKGANDKGKKLLLDARCISCHSIENKGETIAPELSKVSSKLYPERISLILKDPHALWNTSQMPIFGFSSDDIQNLVTFMSGEYIDLDLDEAESSKDTELVKSADKEKGRSLIEKYGCTGCHDKIEGVKDRGETGPELTSIGSSHLDHFDFGEIKVPSQIRIVANWLYNKMANSRLFKTDLKMPDFAFNDVNAQAVTTYLLSLKAEETPAAYVLPLGKTPHPYTPQGPFGKILDKYRCLVCHKINGQGGELAPDLSQEGSRVKKDWLERFMKAPDTIRPLLTDRMLIYKIEDSENEALYDYFRAVLLDDRVENETMKVQQMNLNDPGKITLGKSLYLDKYTCNACHQINQKGGTIAPDITKTGQRLRPEWIVYYLHDPKAFVMRSVEPVYKLTDSEIESLTAFIISPKEGK
jgi:mono/diheme cytochrome c family protein